jgi:hypothetical protein
MVRKAQPPATTPQETKPPPEQANGADGKQNVRERKQPLPDRAEVERLRAELNAELTSNDGETVQKAEQMSRAMSLRAVERLGLIFVGHQPATPPQVVMASIAILKAAGLVDKHAAGITAETTEAAE